MSDFYERRPDLPERMASAETMIQEMVRSNGNLADEIKEMRREQRENFDDMKGLARTEAENAFELAKDEMRKSHEELEREISELLAVHTSGVEWVRIVIPASVPIVIFIIAMLIGSSPGEAAMTSANYQGF